MVDIISLAHGVAEKNGGADVELAPEHSLKNVKEKTRIVVVPVGIKHKQCWAGIDEATRPKAVVFSMFDSEEDVFRAIEAGACGYLSKQSSGA